MPFKDPEKRKEYKQRPDVKEKQKENMKTYRNIKIECGCGGGYFMKHKGRHERTKIHINNLEEKEKNDLEKWRKIEPLI
jgi:hypothetical protein